ncbi:peptidoglycan editing factor PgeF [Aureimonas populi]|uniref:Purine nucleoside phosphorylase n=1 Tax=Aureimonas populi TaxID=1701758 RepID=A0ABW5CJU5_9HYPH|nr:peptidoglycan editing factor PgeF [Aureimonas populi]
MLDRPPESPLSEHDIVSDDWLAALPGLRHGFFTRAGGVSRGLYRGLNAGLGSQDAPEAVRENRERATRFLGMEEIATPWQVHSPDAVIVDAPFGSERPKADAIVTATPGLAIGVVTADCGPVLLASEDGAVVGAAHAGWRGAVGGVLEATIEAMERLGARRAGILAVLGPSITAAHYEVGEDMAETAARQDATAERFFLPGTKPGKRQFDLPAYIVARLERAGTRARFVGRCTYAEEESFFSFRRTTHRGEPDYGRQLSAIAIGR